jgi:arginyl-tRNA synthetase
MNLFTELRSLVIAELEAMTAAGALPAGLDMSAVAVEPPRDPAHGDMATNAAMVLAKPAGKQPRAIAEDLAARLSGDPRIASAEVAGPGFLAIRSMLSSSRPTPPARCMWAMCAGRWLGMRCPTCLRLRAGT